MDDNSIRPIHHRMRDGLAGLAEGWRRERSMRLHLLLAAIGLGILFAVKPGIEWLLAYWVLAVMGLAIELVNASIEALLDRLHPGRDLEIGAAKDLVSGATLVVNVAAVGVFLGALLG